MILLKLQLGKNSINMIFHDNFFRCNLNVQETRATVILYY